MNGKNTRRKKHLRNKYVTALLVVSIAVSIRFLVGVQAGPSAFVIFLIGMLASSWVGGVGPGLVAQTIILIVHASYFAEPKAHSSTSNSIAGLIAFYGVGLTVAILSDFVSNGRKRERKSTIEARIQRERLHAVLFSMADGVIATDADGKIVLINPLAESLLEIRASQAIGKSLSEIFRVQNAASEEIALDSIVTTAARNLDINPATNSPFLLTHTGRSIPIAFSATPIRDHDENLSGTVIVVRDETDRRNNDETMRTADRRKDEFIAMLAHELRNPLAAISMGLELIKFTQASESNHTEIKMVERQAHHMVRLIDDLLDVSRISRGKLELRKSLINLQTVLNHAVDACRPIIEEFGHELIIDLPTQPVVLQADPDRLMQVVTNLLNNAAKYTPSGGRIAIHTAIHDTELRLTVADNGRGISASQMPTIFEMFNQPGIARENGHSGLGIGLTLVKRILEMHGGQIEVSSAGIGSGSAFVVSLPVVAQQLSAPASAHGTAINASSAPCKVLLVDDNHDSLFTMSKLVRALGHEVVTANDGIEAIEAAEKHLPHVILMDLGMPRMNGYDAAREIRQRPWGKVISLIAVTGWGQDGDRQRTESAGFNNHLVKPIDISTLSQILIEVGRSHLSGKTHNTNASVATKQFVENDLELASSKNLSTSDHADLPTTPEEDEYNEAT